MFEFVARSIYNSSSLSEITKRWIDEAFHQNGFSQCEQVPSRSIKLYQPPKNINVFEENVINCSGSRKDSSSNNSKTCFSAPTLLEFVQASEFNNLNRSAFETLIEENGAKQVLDLANSKSPADNQIFNNQKKQSYCDVCVYCNSSSPKIYQNGWMCLNESCERFFDLSNSKSKSFTNGPRESLLYKEAEELVYISEFLMHQSEFEDGVILVPYQLQPPSLQFLSSQNVKLRLEEESKKGIYCSDCGRISSRIYWGCLRCNNKKCSTTYTIKTS
ncbi:expressed protein [Phakopsora pachyrhizi]|uniref:Expressed protein n=1 Tax=Phakopsora pachyrhizi TaxID=170000 RepID=A0AAV0BFX3_PHAPC|nr:expressed protein [Phakopsora pachyrhizi]